MRELQLRQSNPAVAEPGWWMADKKRMPAATFLKESLRQLETWHHQLMDDYTRRCLAPYCAEDESIEIGRLPEQTVVQWRKSESSSDGTSHCCEFGVSSVGVVAFEFPGDDPEEEARADLGHPDPEDLLDHLVPGRHEPV